MNAILQALFALVPFSTDLLNVTDKLEADSINSFTAANNNQRSVRLLMTMMMMMMYDDCSGDDD